MYGNQNAQPTNSQVDTWDDPNYDAHLIAMAEAEREAAEGESYLRNEAIERGLRGER